MKAIGLDIGDRRIGVAVSDDNMIAARPLVVIKRTDDETDIARITAMTKEQGASTIIYGNPLLLSGQSGKQARLAGDFAERVGRESGVPVIPQDERLSSAEAEKTLIAQGVKREKRRSIVDKVAAAIILQAYLDSRRG